MSLRRTVAAAVLASATLTLASPTLAASGTGPTPWVLKPGEFYSELSGSVFAANSTSFCRIHSSASRNSSRPFPSRARAYFW